MNQTCPSASRLDLFARGEISGNDFEQIAAHVRACLRCEHELANLEPEHDELVGELAFLNSVDLDTIDFEPTGEQRQLIARVTREIESGSLPDSQTISLDHGKRLAKLLHAGPVRLGRFELRQELGSGSFGHVFRAYDTELDRTVAIKVQRAGSIASPEEQRQFLHEARSVARLKHPNIVSLYETGESDEQVCYLVTEFVDGTTLDKVMASRRFSFEESAALIRHLAWAVHYAHQSGIVHRDIKPSNILLDPQMQPHLTDFGLAKRESIEGSMTSDGRVMGTPAYMPPEHARGLSRESDARSDIYSMGVILYELLTGERPFQGTRRLLLLQVLEEEPRSLRQLDDQIPRDLETICLKAMAKQPTRRYQSALELADDLGRFSKGEPITARPISGLEKLQRWSVKNPFAVAVMLAVLVSSIAGFLYLRSLNNWIVKEMALDNARLYSDMLDEFNEYYSEIRQDFHSLDTTSGINYLNKLKEPPLPATMRIEVSERISRNSSDGMQARIFSPHSFREELRPKDEFERATLTELNSKIKSKQADQDGALEYYRFQNIDGRPFLRYSRGQLMTASCIECHNTHDKSPKTDWQVGDLAGVFTLNRPLSNDVERTREGFQGASILVIALALSLSVFGLVVSYQVRKSKRLVNQPI